MKAQNILLCVKAPQRHLVTVVWRMLQDSTSAKRIFHFSLHLLSFMIAAILHVDDFNFVRRPKFDFDVVLRHNQQNQG